MYSVPRSSIVELICFMMWPYCTQLNESTRAVTYPCFTLLKEIFFQNGLTPLHLCAQEDRLQVAQLLLRAGAQKDTKTKQGYTPLHIACHHGRVNMVRLLIEQGAEVNPVTSAGYTPLHQAAQQGHVLVISLLLKNKADPNAVTNVSGITSQLKLQYCEFIKVFLFRDE